jgi:hypothetical protein
MTWVFLKKVLPLSMRTTSLVSSIPKLMQIILPKHVDVYYYYFTRKQIAEQVIKILHTSTSDQPADMLTKLQD